MRRLLAVLTMCALSGQASAAAEHDWQIYANAKYQFQTCYPADLLHAQGESPASDGEVFSGADGARLTASAIYNIDNETVAQLSEETGQRLAGADGKITYRHVVRNGFTLSGTSGANIFYTRTILSHDAIKHFELVYPGSRAVAYNPVAARLQSCFLDLQNR